MDNQKKTVEQRIEELQLKQKQLKEQEKRLKKRLSEKERKERTRHLIEVGGAVYSVLGRRYQAGDEKRLIAFLKKQDERGNFFTTAMNTENNE